jgi:hypothetical protein
MEKIFNHKSFNYLFGNLPLVSLTPAGNLLPVSEAKFAAGVVDSSGKVHLDLRISPLILEKIQNDPNVIFKDLGKMIHERT